MTQTLTDRETHAGAQQLTNRFRNECGVHAGFSGKELRGLLAVEFTDIQFLTGDYLRFKYGERLPEIVLDAVCAHGVRDVAAPSVYAIAHRSMRSQRGVQ